MLSWACKLPIAKKMVDGMAAQGISFYHRADDLPFWEQDRWSDSTPRAWTDPRLGTLGWCLAFVLPVCWADA